MASEHEHNAWRYVRVEEGVPDYFYARCRICNVLARRKAETQTWELLEDKPTYRQLEQQLAQARDDAKKYAQAVIDMQDAIVKEEQTIEDLREENQRLKMELSGVNEEYDHALTGLGNHLDALRKAQAENAAMRALLERAIRALASDLPEVRMAVTVYDEETAHRLRRQFLDEIHAVLAQHKEQSE